MTPRNYSDEELAVEVERCYTDELVLELVRRFNDALAEIDFRTQSDDE